MDRDDVITPWVKSSYSDSGANCVEFARSHDGAVAVRDSKNPDGGLLAFSPQRWAAFTSRVTEGTSGAA